MHRPRYGRRTEGSVGRPATRNRHTRKCPRLGPPLKSACEGNGADDTAAHDGIAPPVGGCAPPAHGGHWLQLGRRWPRENANQNLVRVLVIPS